MVDTKVPTIFHVMIKQRKYEKKARKYIIRSKAEKLDIVKQALADRSVWAWEPEIRHKQARVWIEKYQANGETGLEFKKQPSDPLAHYKRRKALTYEERLQYCPKRKQ